MKDVIKTITDVPIKKVEQLVSDIIYEGDNNNIGYLSQIKIVKNYRNNLFDITIIRAKI
jgi:hypothetical protein